LLSEVAKSQINHTLQRTGAQRWAGTANFKVPAFLWGFTT